MGGKSSSQTIGYKYHLGFHFVGPSDHDALLAIRMGDKNVWEGYAADGSIYINQPEIFGGDKKEGGVQGTIDILDGNPAQLQNDYLETLFGTTDYSAFRGAVSYVWRQVYIGNNPYLKPIRHKSIAINSKYDNWYPEKAKVNSEARVKGSAIYIAMDGSLSMDGTRMINQKRAVKNFLESLKGYPNDVKIVLWAGVISSTIERFKATDADYDALITWVDNLSDTPGVFGTDFGLAVSLASAFYETAEGTLSFADDTFSNLVAIEAKKNRILVFATDGEPVPASSVSDAVATLAGIEDVDVYAFNIDLTDTQYTAQLDNTPSDGVPVVSSGNPESLSVALQNAFAYWADMNAAHWLRLSIVDPKIGGNDDPTSIDEDSFRAAADLFYDEGMGFSFAFKGRTRDEIRATIEDHCNCVTFKDRTSGKWKINLIRNDYVKANLPVFDGSIIVKGDWVEGPITTRPRELPNHVVVKFTDRENGEPTSLSRSNVAGVQLTGKVKSLTVDYPGVTYRPLATSLCHREMVSRTTESTRGAFRVSYLDPSINIGDAIRIDVPELGIDDQVFRIKEIEGEDMQDHSALLRVESDKWDFRNDIPVADVVISLPSNVAQPSTIRLVEESPYYELVAAQGQTAVDDELTADPDGGLFHATGNQPTGAHTDMDIAVDSGAGWVNGGTAFYSPTTTTLAVLTSAADDTSLDVNWATGLETVTAGSLAYIGGEYVRVDNMTRVGDVVTLTIGRGCLDTVPQAHGIGESIIFWQGNAGSDEVTYLASEQIDVRLLGKVASGVLALSDATTDQVTFNNRAIRPYPAGKLQVEASYAPTGILPAVATLTWAHRDRLAQTYSSFDDHKAGDIGPELGTTYTVEVRAVLPKADVFAATDFFAVPDFFYGEDEGTLVYSEDVGSVTTWDYDEDGVDFFAPTNFFAQPDFFGVVAGSAAMAEFKVIAKRGGYESWQSPRVRGRILSPVTNLTAEEV